MNTSDMVASEGILSMTQQQEIALAETSNGSPGESGVTSNGKSVIQGSSLILDSSAVGQTGTSIGGIGTPGIGAPGNGIRPGIGEGGIGLGARGPGLSPNPEIQGIGNPIKQTVVGNEYERHQIKKSIRQNELQKDSREFFLKHADTTSTTNTDDGCVDTNVNASMNGPGGNTVTLDVNVEQTSDGISVDWTKQVTTANGQEITKNRDIATGEGNINAQETTTADNENTGDSFYQQSDINKSTNESAQASTYSSISKQTENGSVSLNKGKSEAFQRGQGGNSQASVGINIYDSQTQQAISANISQESEEGTGNNTPQTTISGYYYDSETGTYIPESKSV